jgi:hypothetical protein
MIMTADEWVNDRVLYLKGLKSRTEQQDLLLLLYDKQNKSAQDEKKLSLIIKAEKALVRASKARQEAAKFINDEKQAEKKAERKARDHELYNAAGLLIMAGLVDTKTGKPTLDKGELLGALLGLANLPADHQKRVEWKKVGDAVLAEKD